MAFFHDIWVPDDWIVYWLAPFEHTKQGQYQFNFIEDKNPILMKSHPAFTLDKQILRLPFKSRTSTAWNLNLTLRAASNQNLCTWRKFFILDSEAVQKIIYSLLPYYPWIRGIATIKRKRWVWLLIRLFWKQIFLYKFFLISEKYFLKLIELRF